jgi:hypothetical protein
MAELQGGNFGNGFASAFITKMADVNSLVGIEESLDDARIIVAAIIGGTVSAMTGGKFANGAITAALMQAVNGNNDAKRMENSKWAQLRASVNPANWSLLPQGAVDFAAGWGDTLSFGITSGVRSYWSIDGGWLLER